MTTTVRDAAAKPAVFLKAEVEAVLRQGLGDVVAAQAVMAGSGPGAGAASQEIDSLSAVELLCAIDKIVGFEVKQSVVKAGGYRSVQAAVDHILPGIERAWMKRKGGGR